MGCNCGKAKIVQPSVSKQISSNGIVIKRQGKKNNKKK